MRYVVSFLIVIVLFTSCQDSKTQKARAMRKRLTELSRLDPGGYRFAKWGMSVDQVRRVVNPQSESSRNLLDYSFAGGEGHYVRFESINGHPSVIHYMFGSHGLHSVMVAYKQNPLTTLTDCYANDFYDVEKLLVEKYGEPITKDREGTAQSIRLGQGEYNDTWWFIADTTAFFSDSLLDKASTILRLGFGKLSERFIEGAAVTVTYICPRSVRQEPVVKEDKF